MRQVGDMLVWLALILVVAGVVYFTPRFANYVASERSGHGRESRISRVMAYQQFESPDATP
jgi:hypothetical protein